MKPKMSTRKHRVSARIMSWLLVLTMLVGMVPINTVTARAAGVPETLVTSLAELYDGDEARAREELQALYDAGLLNDDGSLVELDIREDGESVELDELAQRIADGKEVGALTVNGNTAAPEKIMQISQVSSMLEVIRLIDKDVEITDEHVANLQSLLEGIADGSIDLSDVISRGGVQMIENQKTRQLSAGNTAELPANTGSGEVDATDGKYTAPYISGGSYEAEHEFELSDPENTTWYTTSTSDAGTGDATSEAVVTLSCDKTTYSLGDKITLTAKLDKVPKSYVHFKYVTFSSAVDLTWEPDPSTVYFGWNERSLETTFWNNEIRKKQTNNWIGTQCVYIYAYDIQGATFEDGKTTWSQIVKVEADDKEAVSAGYPVKTVEFGPNDLSKFSKDTVWYYRMMDDVIPSTGDFDVSFSFSPYYREYSAYLANPDVDESDIAYRYYSYLHVPEPNVSYSPENIYYDNNKCFNQDILSGASREEIIKNNKTWFILHVNGSDSDITFEKVTVKVPQHVTADEVVSVTVPEGTYYSGQVVPVTVTLKEYAVATADLKLTVNNVECPLLNDVGTEAKKFTFGYTVKEVDSGAINVTALSEGLVNKENVPVTIDGSFPAASFGIDENVIIKSDVKRGSLDWDNVKYGIDDADAGDQTVTVIIPFKSGVPKDWIANETVEINPAVSMSVPGYEEAEVGAYLKSAYFSTDGGVTRYPVYVLGDNADALVVRFAPTMNVTSFLRKDTLSLYIDTEVGTTGNYLGEWTDKKEDNKGFAYFTGKSNDNTAPAAVGKTLDYYVKSCVAFDKDETTDRTGYDEANIMKDAEGSPLGFYKDGVKYVAVQSEDYSKQNDVELWVNEALYRAVSKGVRAEEPNSLILNYQVSGRDNFTFTSPKFFTWSTSNEQIATVVKNEETGAGQISLTGAGGIVTITLTVGNGSDSNKYDLTFTFTVLEGKEPFLNIPEFSRERVTLTDTDTDVLFATNITARNAALGKNTTEFTAKLYAVAASGDDPSGEPIWTGSFESTLENTLTHITVPGAQLTTAGTYAVVISTKYEGGEIDGVVTNAEDFSATAYLIVKQAPLKVALKALDSYSADYNAIPEIEYTVTPSSAKAVVEYTIQKSGEDIGERLSVTGGTIPFTAEKPEGLKEAYTITVYARSADAAEDEAWSVDSMVLRVYNTDILELIVNDVLAGEIGGTTDGIGENVNGTTVTMDNHGKLADYGITGESYQLTVDDLNALRTDMSLQKIISVNYGSGVWGLLSDKMQWNSSDSSLVSVNFKQGGIYSDIRNYSYVSYGPATDFLLVGKDKTDGVTVTATHAATGKTASVTVAAETLKDQLYIFQFNPQAETDVVYTNGAGEQRSLKSNENGVLAVYEPQGIASAVMALSVKDGQTYVGTIYNDELQSGEQDIASLQLYPCNNLRLRSISNLTLSFRNPNGSAYNGQVTLRAGVYKNGVYCPDAKSFLVTEPAVKYGAQDDIPATVTDGKLTVGFNPMEFKNDPDNTDETGAYPGDKVTYVVEYRVAGYQTNYALISVYTDLKGEQKPTDSVIQLKTVRGGANVPQITRQTIQLYSDDKPSGNTRDITDFSENIGVSGKVDKVVLSTDYVLPSSLVSVDEKGRTTISGEFALYTVGGRKLTGQMEYDSTEAKQIIKIDDINGANLFVFPFSSSPIGHHVYTMTDESLKADGISDEGENPVISSRIKAMFVHDGITLTSTTLPFGISNLSHQKDVADEDSGIKTVAADAKNQLEKQMSISEIFKSVNVNDMLKKGFTFLGGLSAGGGDTPFSMMILPTEDPAIFRIVAFVGNKKVQNRDNQDGLKIEYDADTMYEDFNSLLDDDDDDSGEGSYDASFSGTLVLEAGYDFNTKSWKIDFRGGSVGLGFSAKYDWTQNFMCGPVPVTISFEVGTNIDLEVSFASKSSVKLMLVDATIGVSIEAFVGLGFDLSIAKLKLGIYGRIGADVNFLLLSDFKKSPSTGTKLDINGEIGIRLEVKVAVIKYKKTFASTSFNWSKKWNKYDSIMSQWNSTGFAEIKGVTLSGRAYAMNLLSDGTALVAIEGGGEIEDRDYLELAERAWNNGISSGRRLMKAADPVTNALTSVQTNAYPYSNPVLTDDGSMFLYISDNDNAKESQSVVSYAVNNGSGYDNKGAVDENDTVLADSDVVASGTGSNIFAAWVKQLESPEKEMRDAVTNDDLGMMINATEIYAGTYNGTDWTTERLTDNSIADMSPTVASCGDRAIVAWRSLSATEMPEQGGSQDLANMFNAENNINYRIYNGTAWTDAQVAYNGATGTVNAIDSAMLSDGTAMLTYTVRTGEDVTTTETFYTLIGTDGDIITTGRLTNDSCADTNAQVTAVGSRFVLGWYSEHDTGEKVTDPETGEEKDVVAHDIRLARINADGSIDADFPESIGGDAASTITSSFRFSAPADNNDLSNLSIVWSQTKDSESAEDAGRCEIKAMRFYESEDKVGMTAQTNIAETGYNFKVDHFDTYTDESGKVYALILGSDYSSLNGIEAFDQIDLTNLPLEVGNGNSEPASDILTVLEQNPIAAMMLGSGTFKETAIEVTANTNLRELVTGLELPVQFTVKNTGTSTINDVNVRFGNIDKTIEGLSLLPDQSTIITTVYTVPEDKVEDVDYTITADGVEETGTLVLNRPDVGISDMKLLSEENGERIVQVTLNNASGIPLAGSGKTVKVGIYKTPKHEEEDLLGSIITITDENALADIDDGIYGAVQTIRVEDMINGEDEIPDTGIQLYAYAWVEDCNELYTKNNDATLAFKGLLTKNDGETISVDTSIEAKSENETTVYTVGADIRNNSLKEQAIGIPVIILQDSDGNALAQKAMLTDTQVLGAEERRSDLSVTFTSDELNNTVPAKAAMGYFYKVSFDTNGGTGTFEDLYTDLDGYITFPTTEPTPPELDPEVHFVGWYTEATKGELITADHKFTADTTLYAHYVGHQHDFTYEVNSEDSTTIIATCKNTDGRCNLENCMITLTIAAPMMKKYGETGEGISKATLTGLDDFNNATEKSVAETEITYVGRDNTTYEESSTAPTDAGRYTAKITVEEKTISVDYEIAKAETSITTNPTAMDITYGQTLADSMLTGGTASLDGSFAWKDSTIMPAVSDSQTTEYAVIFTPTDKNYDTAEGMVKLTVNKKDVTVTAADQNVVLNGTIKTGAKKAKLKDALKGHVISKVTLVSSSTKTFTENGTITPSDAVIKDAEGNDVTDNYNITYSDGTLQVNKIAGKCGENATFILDTSTGHMSISGTGAMEDYKYSTRAPWAKYRDLIKDVFVVSGITRIGTNTFSGCKNLTEVTGCVGIQTIGTNAFKDCAKITKIPACTKVTEVGAHAFSGCKKLTTFGVNAGVVSLPACTRIGGYAFYGCSGIKKVNTYSPLTYLGVSAFRNCTALTAVQIGANCTAICSYAFCGDTALTTVTGCVGLTGIGDFAFYGNTKLASVAGCTKVANIGKSIFRNCSALVKVGATANQINFAAAKAVGEYAFSGCKAAKYISLGANLTSIGQYAFQNNAALAKLYIRSSKLTTVGDHALKGILATAVIYVPSAKVKTYTNGVLKGKGQSSKVAIKAI